MDIELEEALKTWELEMNASERLVQVNEADSPPKDWNSTQGSSMLGSPERKWEVLPLIDWPVLGFACEFELRKGRVRRYVTYCQAKRRRKQKNAQSHRLEANYG